MPVAPSDYPSNTLAAVEDVLANCAQFRTLMEAADVTAAKGKTYWHSDRRALAAPYTILRLLPETDGETDAIKVTTHAWSVDVYIRFRKLTAGASNEKELTTLALNAYGALRAQIAALIGTGTYIARCQRVCEPPERVPDDDNGGFTEDWDFAMTFTGET